MRTLIHVTLLAMLSMLGSTTRADATPRLVTEEFMLPTRDAGIELYVRNKHLARKTRFPGSRILLYVHGATTPSETTFDLKLNGQSWMDYIAARGFDVYLVDIRGYGRSTRPREMDLPPAANQPVVRTETAVQDLGVVVDFIRKRRGVEKINLLGWSWGTAIVGWYTAQHNDKIHRLALYAPLWIRSPVLTGDALKKVGAYRTVSGEAMKKRWLAGAPEDRRADLIPPGWFDNFADASIASDPVGSSKKPPVLRAPNGVVQDRNEYWGVGRALYDPAGIRVPTLIVHAEWDADLPSYMSQEYFKKLVHVPFKRLVEIGEGTHFILMEKNRMQLFGVVQQFLEDEFKIGS